MKKFILLFLPVFLIACAEEKPRGPWEISHKKIDADNYEVTIVGEPGVSKKKLMDAMDKKNRELCGGPSLPRHYREHINTHVKGGQDGYTIITEAQCFTDADADEYEKAVAASKKKKKKK